MSDDGFRCSSFHCRTELYKKGTDYGYYSSNHNCTACKILCAADKDCGGVDCDGVEVLALVGVAEEIAVVLVVVVWVMAV